MRIEVDVERLISDFGGNTRLSQSLAEIGVTCTPGAVHKWKVRGKVPLERIAALGFLRQKQGIPFDLNSYIQGIE